jgi:phage shock protein A
MRIFSCLADIANADLDEMLGKAEDAERLLKLIVQEIEDAMVEVKASCAGAMAVRARAQRSLDEARDRAREWEERARLAVQRQRDQLAREALMEKRRCQERAEALGREAEQAAALVRQCKEHIAQLEDRLGMARERQYRLLEKRLGSRRGSEQPAPHGAPAPHGVPEAGGAPEAGAAEGPPAAADGPASDERRPQLDEEFARRKRDEQVEKELRALKEELARRGGAPGSG